MGATSRAVRTLPDASCAPAVPYDGAVIDAVAFDLDGVLIDSEPTWTAVRRAFVLANGGRWPDGADRRMMGMATTEWAAYLHDDLGVPLPEAGSRSASSPTWRPGSATTRRSCRARSRRCSVWLALAARPGVVVAVGPDRAHARGRRPARLLPGDAVDRGGRRRQARPRRVPGSGAAARRPARPVRRGRGLDQRPARRPRRRDAGRRRADPQLPPEPDELARADAVIASLDDLTETFIDPPLA